MTSSDSPPRDAVLFDIDGTLVDSNYHHTLSWHRAFANRGIDVPAYRLHRAIGMGGDKLVAHVTDETVEDEHGDAVRDGWEEEYSALVDEVPALPGAADLVRRVAEQGYAVGFASSGKSRFSDKALEVLGVADQVDAVTSSDDADESKPDPDILAATLDQLGEVNRVVVLGDTPWDVEAASRIGLQCLTVLSGGFSRAELEEAGAALVVESLTELLDLDWTPHLASPRRSPTS